MSTQRILKIQRLIKEEVSLIIAFLKDPRLGFITITDVKVTPDLKHAKIFVSIMEPEEKQEQIIKILDQAKGHIRSELAHKINFRYTPEIFFKIDDSISYSEKIEKILLQLKEEAP